MRSASTSVPIVVRHANCVCPDSVRDPQMDIRHAPTYTHTHTHTYHCATMCTIARRRPGRDLCAVTTTMAAPRQPPHNCRAVRAPYRAATKPATDPTDGALPTQLVLRGARCATDLASRPPAEATQQQARKAAAPLAAGAGSSSLPGAASDHGIRSDVCHEAMVSKLLADAKDPARARQLAIAKAAGFRMSVNTEKQVHSALHSTEYPPLDESQRLYPQGTLEDTQVELLRRSNLSMPCLIGQRVQATVYAVTKFRVWVDVGNSLTVIGRKVRLAIR